MSLRKKNDKNVVSSVAPQEGVKIIQAKQPEGISDPQVRISQGVTIHDSKGTRPPRRPGEGVQIVRQP